VKLGVTSIHDIAQHLVEGYGIKPWKSPTGIKCWRLYDHEMKPVANITDSAKKLLEKYLDPKMKLWKKGPAGSLTLNLKTVRQLHGRTLLNRYYKKLNSTAA
jgi:hypothetical protein